MSSLGAIYFVKKENTDAKLEVKKKRERKLDIIDENVKQETEKVRDVFNEYETFQVEKFAKIRKLCEQGGDNLDWSKLRIDEDDVLDLAMILSELPPKLKTFDLSSTVVEDHAFVNLMISLKTQRATLRHLRLNGSQCGFIARASLLQLMRGFHQLEEIKLVKFVGLGAELKKFLNNVADLEVSRFKLVACGLKPNDYKLFKRFFVSRHCQLVEFCLENHGINNESIALLCEGLSTNTSLRKFSLRTENLSLTAVETINEVIQVQTYLEILCLQKCCVNSDAFLILCTGVILNDTLRYFDLRYNMISDAICQNLQSALGNRTHLTNSFLKIDLGGNQITNRLSKQPVHIEGVSLLLEDDEVE